MSERPSSGGDEMNNESSMAEAVRLGEKLPDNRDRNETEEAKATEEAMDKTEDGCIDE